MISIKEIYPSSSSTPGELKELKTNFEKCISKTDVGFISEVLNSSAAQECFELGKTWAHQRSHFFHIGIGGSSLGPEMLVKALLPQKKNITFINNIDPDDLAYKLNSADIRDSVFFVVSKSGSTAETLAALAIILEKLTSIGIPQSHWKDYLVFATDPVVGELKEIALQNQITCLDIPPSVGGRYSVLTPVGYFPYAFLGGQPTQLLEGAQEFYKHHQSHTDLYELASFIFNQAMNGKTQTVFMPYSSLLKEWSAWFVQLWAESLGKEGKGLTPIAAYGATDQHSQMQLFMEGPSDKILVLLDLATHKEDFKLANPFGSLQFKRLDGITLKSLLQAEFHGTLAALKESQKPLVWLRLNELNPQNLGQLILFCECLTVIVGLLFKIDPFNQPGVELGKRKAWEWLDKA
jgi:glucose-6-phosphate isomerase